MNDPKHWRDRADEARQLAEMIVDAQARAQMLRIAEGYDRLAERAAKIVITQKPVVPSRNLP